MQAERELFLKEWKRGWRIHAAIYAAVNCGLIVLNVLLVEYTEASFYWFFIPLLGWGIGLTFHYCTACAGPTARSASNRQRLSGRLRSSRTAPRSLPRRVTA
jgi:hypothetical protein